MYLASHHFQRHRLVVGPATCEHKTRQDYRYLGNHSFDGDRTVLDLFLRQPLIYAAAVCDPAPSHLVETVDRLSGAVYAIQSLYHRLFCVTDGIYDDVSGVYCLGLKPTQRFNRVWL